jgi:Zn-dependent M28 family amino/carboxypeptidase
LGSGTGAGFDGERALELVATQQRFGPRVPGTEAHRRAGDWILAELERLGWKTEEQVFTYRGVEVRNLIGKREGAGGPGWVLLGAHYDTRPRADRDPDDPEGFVPGANDGASGVAVLLELARVLPFQEERGGRVWMVFFDAEDSGGIGGWDWIVGSSHFAEALVAEPEAVVVVDMVGDKDLELYWESNSDPDLRADIWAVAQVNGASAFIPKLKYSILDDHVPFRARGIAAVDIIDFDYPYWHTREDTLDKISAESLEQVGTTLQRWILDRD